MCVCAFHETPTLLPLLPHARFVVSRGPGRYILGGGGEAVCMGPADQYPPFQLGKPRFDQVSDSCARAMNNVSLAHVRTHSPRSLVA